MEKTKILIIEDDKFLLKLYSNKLNLAGFEVFASISGEEGMNKIEVEAPDLIILDLVLPRISGFEILRELKKNPETQDIPVIILTNLAQESDKKRGLELGAKDYVIKTDISVNDLPDLVNKHLSQQENKA